MFVYSRWYILYIYYVCINCAYVCILSYLVFPFVYLVLVYHLDKLMLILDFGEWKPLQ